MKSMWKFVITGGPCGGKTSVIKALQCKFAGQVAFVGEMATALLDVFPLPHRDVVFSSDWLYQFQSVVYAAQVGAEVAWLASPYEVMICDRGRLDGAAYLGNKEVFCRLVGESESAMLAAYDWVFHLESLAVQCPDRYLALKAGNSNRYESVEEAQKVDTALKEAWSGHVNRLVLSGQDDLESKIQLIRQVIADHLAQPQGDLTNVCHY
ncbi:MAG: ATP-binding protein [Candidatus Vogelbacteria bacterium]|nr:ATP-binding protein [Candidatus Vogelbacteria bacterium]